MTLKYNFEYVIKLDDIDYQGHCESENIHTKNHYPKE